MRTRFKQVYGPDKGSILVKVNDLHDYKTGEYIREATDFEHKQSIEASEFDGGYGVVIVYGLPCFVQ